MLWLQPRVFASWKIKPFPMRNTVTYLCAWGVLRALKKCWNCTSCKGLLGETLIVSQPYYDVSPFYAKPRNPLGILTPVERNQTMGHLGSIYKKYYIPTHIARDFQSIYFGSPSQDLLIESVTRMGLSRDWCAPVELNNDQLDEVQNDPKLIALRKEREEYKN